MPPSHCEGSRDSTMNIQITGTHKAGEVPRTLAGSKYNNAKNRTSQAASARVGDIQSYRVDRIRRRRSVQRGHRVFMRPKPFFKDDEAEQDLVIVVPARGMLLEKLTHRTRAQVSIDHGAAIQ